MTIKVAALVTAVVVLAIIAIALYVGKKASESGDGFQAGLASLRSKYFVFLIVTIVVLLGITLGSTAIPYPDTKKGEPDLVVKVTGRTWSWQLSQTTLPVGKDIEFAVAAADVTHGFGIYNSDGQILTQVQAMPGYVNRLRYTFEETGVYKVLCMEYCGVAHHNMITELNVVDISTETSEDAAEEAEGGTE